MPEHDYREFASKYCQVTSEGTMDELLDMYADDVELWVNVRQDLLPLPFAKNKQDIREFFEVFSRGTRPKLVCRSVMVDGDRIAIEAVGATEFGPDYTYANQYVFMLDMRDGKIARVREYLDTLYAQEAFAYMQARNAASDQETGSTA